jgi:hypothetical protein
MIGLLSRRSPDEDMRQHARAAAFSRLDSRRGTARLHAMTMVCCPPQVSNTGKGRRQGSRR